MNPMPETICAATRDGSERDARHHDVAEAVLAHEQEERGPHADERVRPQARGLLRVLPLQADERRQDEREPQLGDLLDALTARERGGKRFYGVLHHLG